MNIVILGAGEVGRTIIKELEHESDLNLTAVDLNSQRLNEIRERYQVATVTGHASHPDVQREAGVGDADLVLAVTGSDEVNMVACQVAYTLFNVPKRIARIRSDVYTMDAESLFTQEHMPINITINPEQVVTENIVQLIEHPGSNQVLTFANGLAVFASFNLPTNSKLVGTPISQFHKKLIGSHARLIAVYRHGTMNQPDFDSSVQVGDELFLVTPAQRLRRTMHALLPKAEAYRKILIAGGGHIGTRLALELEKEHLHDVKIVEINPDRIMELSQRLNKTITLKGDATDRDFLRQNNIDKCDLFCAVTNDDEVNVMSSLLAKRMGVRHTIALVAKVPYVELIGSTNIDVAISPQQATASSILSHVREQSSEKVQRIKHGEAEVLEMVAIGDRSHSKVISRHIDELKLPDGASVCAIIKNDKVIVDFSDVVVEGDDHLIFVVFDKKHIEAIQRLFRPAPSFF